MNNNNTFKLVSPNEALNRGNLFETYFWPYKYVANLRPLNEKEMLMQKIQEYAFAAHELNLYLDIYKDNRDAIKLYNEYATMANKYISEYEQKYGIITLNSNENYPWMWVNSPWPWERQ